MKEIDKKSRQLSERFNALLLLTFVLPAFNLYCQQTITVNNIKPRLDDQGEIIDAHDGRVIQFEGKFYWYGTRYGNTNGFTTANRYVCYSSADLMNWQKEGALLPHQPEGVYYRPHVIYNKKTRKYVLWYNWYPTLWKGQFAVATSDNPEGPFVILNDNVPMANSHLGLGDLGLFVDDDGTAYVSYNTIHDHQVSVEKLDENYTSSTLQNGGMISKHMEAGSMFKRNNKYYLLTDYTCCFCNYGSGARVYMADNPLKDYRYTGNINRYPGKPEAALTDGLETGNVYGELQRLENQWQGIRIEFSEKEDVNRLEISLFTGNRPENCGDVNNPRVHPPIVTPEFELMTWNEGQWKSPKVLNLLVEKKALGEVIIIKTEPIRTSKVTIQPKTRDHDRLFVYEVSLQNENEVISRARAYVVGPSVPERPIIPAQQTYVMELKTPEGPEFIWMGDLWGSASDNIKGHDYQYWSAPLRFNEQGWIEPLKWVDQWELEIIK